MLPNGKSGGDQNLFFLDFVSQKNMITITSSLLKFDQVLTTKSKESLALVNQYAENNALFFDHFAKFIVKMGNISPLTDPVGKSGRLAGRST
uniref:Plant heme peroxidase family profile domain-containing protein n=1 Tax=Solanum lycopersicum TaxID=4081 RepID=A0A3Q7J607_SOLLC